MNTSRRFPRYGEFCCGSLKMDSGNQEGAIDGDRDLRYGVLRTELEVALHARWPSERGPTIPKRLRLHLCMPTATISILHACLILGEFRRPALLAHLFVPFLTLSLLFFVPNVPTLHFTFFILCEPFLSFSNLFVHLIFHFPYLHT